jgi:hypothetical protein
MVAWGSVGVPKEFRRSSLVLPWVFRWPYGSSNEPAPYMDSTGSVAIQMNPHFSMNPSAREGERPREP